MWCWPERHGWNPTPSAVASPTAIWLQARLGQRTLKGSHAEEMNERLRFFIEEFDHIQGIQFIVDDLGGFSCIAVEYLENIADEYANTPVLLYNVRDPVSYSYAINQRGSITRALHDAVSFSKLSSFSKLMVPVGLPSLRIKRAGVILGEEILNASSPEPSSNERRCEHDAIDFNELGLIEISAATTNMESQRLRYRPLLPLCLFLLTFSQCHLYLISCHNCGHGTDIRGCPQVPLNIKGDATNCTSPEAVKKVRQQIIDHIDLWLSYCQDTVQVSMLWRLGLVA